MPKSSERKLLAMELEGVTVETSRYPRVYAHDVRYGDAIVATFRSPDGSGEDVLRKMPREQVERIVRSGLARQVVHAESQMEVALTVTAAVAEQLEFATDLVKRAGLRSREGAWQTEAAVRGAHDRAWDEAMAEMGAANRNLEASLDLAVRSHWVAERFEDGVRESLAMRNARAEKVGDSAEPVVNRNLAERLERRGFRSEWTMETNLPREWLKEAEKGSALVDRFVTAGPPRLAAVERVVLVESALEAAAHQAQAGEQARVNSLYVLVPKTADADHLAKFLKMASVGIQTAQREAGQEVKPVEVAVDVVHRDLSILGFADKAANQGMTFVDGRSPAGRSWALTLLGREADMVRRHVERDRRGGMSL